MRSRYTAYVLRDAAYLLRSWHPSSRPGHLSLEADGTAWDGLEILRCSQGGVTDTSGEVEFIACFRQDGRAQRMREVSRFEKEQGRWYYRDGKVDASALRQSKPGRNEPCLCGSGRKFKKCCGA